MAKILIKRGLIKNINAVELDYGELALAYNEDKTKIGLYAGNENGGKVLVNPDATVPTKVSELTNDNNYQTDTDVSAAIAAAIAATGHASFEKVNSLPSAADAEDNVLYLIMNSTTNHYDIYAKIGGNMELLDDTTVDLSGYALKSELNDKLSSSSTIDGGTF